MPIFYTKTLNCGCMILAFSHHKENDASILGGHTYRYICDDCVKYSGEILDERLETIYENDNKIFVNMNNGWCEIYNY